MGVGISQEQLRILAKLRVVVSAHPAGLSEKELQALLLWVRCNFPHCETHVVFEPAFWQEANRELYNRATKKDKAAAKLLPAARTMLESISRNRKAVPPSLQQQRTAQEGQSKVSSAGQQPAATCSASQQQADPKSPSGDVGGESHQLTQATSGESQQLPRGEAHDAQQLVSVPQTPKPDSPKPVPGKQKLVLYPSDQDRDMRSSETCPLDMGQLPQGGKQGDLEHIPSRSPFTPPQISREIASPPLPPAEQGQAQQGGGGGRQTPEQQGKQPQIASAAGDKTAAHARESDQSQSRREQSYGGDGERNGGQWENIPCQGGADRGEKQLAGDRRDFANRGTGTAAGGKSMPVAERRLMTQATGSNVDQVASASQSMGKEPERAAQAQAQSHALQTPEALAADFGAGAVGVGWIPSRSLARGGVNPDGERDGAVSGGGPRGNASQGGAGTAQAGSEQAGVAQAGMESGQGGEFVQGAASSRQPQTMTPPTSGALIPAQQALSDSKSASSFICMGARPKNITTVSRDPETENLLQAQRLLSELMEQIPEKIPSAGQGPAVSMTAPPSGGTVQLQQTRQLPYSASPATAPASGGTPTLHHFFPITYKKQIYSPKQQFRQEQTQPVSTLEDHEAIQLQQQAVSTDESMIHITASQGIPFISTTTATADSSSQAPSILLSKDFMKQFLLQFKETALELNPDSNTQFPQVFLSPKANQAPLQSTAQTHSPFILRLPDGSTLSFGSAAQGSRAAQKSQLPTPQLGGKEISRRDISLRDEGITSQEDVNKHQTQEDSGMTGAASSWKSQQLIPFLEDSQISDAQVPSATDWTEIKKKALKEFNLTGARSLALPVAYDAQGQNPRWERLDHDVIKELVKAIRDNGLGSPYFKQLLKATFNIYDLTPFDLRSIASMILTDSQVLIWEAKWKRALEELRRRFKEDQMQASPWQKWQVIHQMMTQVVKQGICHERC